MGSQENSWDRMNCVVGKIVGYRYSLTGCDTTYSLLGRGKLWVSFPVITENLLKMS